MPCTHAKWDAMSAYGQGQSEWRLTLYLLNCLKKCKYMFNTLRPRQNGRHFADVTFNRIFENENVRLSIKFSLKFVPKGPINSIPALVQIMAWCRPGGKPLSEPMMENLLTHICVARPQWVNINPPYWNVTGNCNPSLSKTRDLCILCNQYYSCAFSVPTHSLNQWWLFIRYVQTYQWNFSEIQSTIQTLSVLKIHWKCCLERAHHFVEASVCWYWSRIECKYEW